MLMQEHILTFGPHLLIQPVKGLLFTQMVCGGPVLIGIFSGVSLGLRPGLQLVPPVVCLDKVQVTAGGLYAVQGGGVGGIKKALVFFIVKNGDMGIRSSGRRG